MAERLIQRGDGVSFPRTNRVINSNVIDVLDDNGFRIGYITEITESSTRRVDRIRMLSSTAAGRVIEQAPGTEDITLNLNGYSLYDLSLTDRKSLIHRLGGPVSAAKSLMGQREPFHIVKREIHPATGEESRARYYDCWLTSFTASRNIAQTVSIDRAVCQVAQKD